MARIISDIESEKETRARVNKDIFDKLDAIAGKVYIGVGIVLCGNFAIGVIIGIIMYFKK